MIVCLNISNVKSEHSLLSFASIIVALSKTPNIVRVCIQGTPSAETSKYLDRIPRNIPLITSDAPFLTMIQHELGNVAPNSMVVSIEDFSALYLPESLASAAVGVESGLHYCQFEEILNDTPGVLSFAMKYWKAPSFGETKNFACHASTLVQDMSVFLTYEKPFEILDIIKSRKIATPFPSLASQLPLSPKPSLIPWNQVKQMIEQF